VERSLSQKKKKAGGEEKKRRLEKGAVNVRREEGPQQRKLCHLKNSQKRKKGLLGLKKVQNAQNTELWWKEKDPMAIRSARMLVKNGIGGLQARRVPGGREPTN